MNKECTDLDMEEMILKESIVSAAGITSGKLQIGLKGDPSLRETVPLRKRYRSSVDEVFDELTPNLEEMILNRGIYRLFIAFNSGEIRTNSIFDPLRSEIHEAAKLADHAYIVRQFPEISYDDKVSLMRELYATLRASEHYRRLPDYWQNILNRRSAAWQPLSPEDINRIFPTLRVLREIQEYYLRNITVCMVQCIVRMQFNCDGTQIIDARNLQKFLQENLP